MPRNNQDIYIKNVRVNTEENSLNNTGVQKMLKFQSHPASVKSTANLAFFGQFLRRSNYLNTKLHKGKSQGIIKHGVELAELKQNNKPNRIGDFNKTSQIIFSKSGILKQANNKYMKYPQQIVNSKEKLNMTQGNIFNKKERERKIEDGYIISNISRANSIQKSKKQINKSFCIKNKPKKILSFQNEELPNKIKICLPKMFENTMNYSDIHNIIKPQEKYKKTTVQETEENIEEMHGILVKSYQRAKKLMRYIEMQNEYKHKAGKEEEEDSIKIEQSKD